MTVELPGGAVERGTFEMVLPDRIHFAITFSGGTLTNEAIIVGNERYMKMGEVWRRSPPQAGLPRVLTSTGELNQLAAFRLASSSGGLTKGGTESVSNQQCQLYSHKVETNTFEYCVVEDLPVRMKVVQGTTAVITFVFADYNQPLAINAPNVDMP